MGEVMPFLMVVLIVLIVTVGRTYRAKHARDACNELGASNEDAVRLKAEVNRLNERIQVLERLATDPSKRLSDQIDALGPRN
jgi:hypothetical protein